MNCLYCGHELSLEETPAVHHNVGEVLTAEWDAPCRNCGATYHIEQRVSGLPTISEEMIRKLG